MNIVTWRMVSGSFNFIVDGNVGHQQIFMMCQSVDKKRFGGMIMIMIPDMKMDGIVSLQHSFKMFLNVRLRMSVVQLQHQVTLLK